MGKARKTYIKAYGVQLLLSRHPEIRKLKQFNTPSAHGNKLWKSSWLLMEYFYRRGLPHGARVLELGCGWGLAGIYCAKKHGAIVTGADIDDEVFPYLHLHEDINGVKISTMKTGFAGLTGKHLREFEVMIGADICFWNSLVDPLRKLILRALRAGVRLVLLADPGRSPFEELGEHFVNKRGGRILDWTAQRPRRATGRLLEIGSISDFGF
jgi:predicted nicotinamide N-methyase